jgi:hypothetical protein
VWTAGDPNGIGTSPLIEEIFSRLLNSAGEK